MQMPVMDGIEARNLVVALTETSAKVIFARYYPVSEVSIPLVPYALIELRSTT